MNNQLLNVLAGSLLLLLGRKLFWVFVAIVGFLSGIQLAPRFFPNEPEVVVLLIGLVAGLMGALLAVFLQHVAIGIAGFLAGSHLVTRLLSLPNWENENLWWLFLVGGVLGALLTLMLLDWGLIILSSLIGANLISQALPLDQAMATLCFVMLVIVGILIQSRLLRPTAV